MTNWDKAFAAFNVIFMTISHWQDNTNGILFFGFMLIATILMNKEFK